MLSIACMISLCACGAQKTKKCTLQVYADQALEKELPLVGDKFLVTDGKGHDISYSFDSESQLQNLISSGSSCDLLITASDVLLEQLTKDEIISADKTLELMDRPMVLIAAAADSSISFSPEQFFYQEEFAEDDSDEEENPEETEEVEGYRRYLDVLGETVDEEEWQEDWEERYVGLWIQDDISAIGVLNVDSKEGQCAKELLDQYNGAFELLDQIGLIHSSDTKEDLLEAIRTGEVQTGICAAGFMYGEKELQTVKVFDGESDPVLTYFVCLINGAENRKEAKELMTFLQGKHTRRFFEDFGFIMRE